MINFPNCKINLGLKILRKRSDGYHDLETVFYPLPLYDVLEIITGEEDKGQGTRDKEQGFLNNDVQFSISGLTINDAIENNLCIKAYTLLKKDFAQIPSVQMHVHKNIPMGAGLGGGSSDAAFTLKLLNEKFNLNISTEQLIDYAAQLGSDCPFFIINKPCYATGRGEYLQVVDIDLSNYLFVLINPGIHISTAWAFSHVAISDASQQPASLKTLIQQPVETWKQNIVNDFEEVVCKQYPELKKIKDSLYSAGAVYASMTGSGSCFYGIFPPHLNPSISFGNDFKVIHLKKKP